MVVRELPRTLTYISRGHVHQLQQAGGLRVTAFLSVSTRVLRSEELNVLLEEREGSEHPAKCVFVVKRRVDLITCYSRGCLSVLKQHCRRVRVSDSQGNGPNLHRQSSAHLSLPPHQSRRL